MLCAAAYIYIYIYIRISSKALTFFLAKCKRTVSMAPIADRTNMVRHSYPFGSEHMHSIVVVMYAHAVRYLFLSSANESTKANQIQAEDANYLPNLRSHALEDSLHL